MPYSNVADLPANVKKLPPVRQRQFMHVFNSCMKDGKDEATCFAMASGVVKKEVVDFEGEIVEGVGLDELTIELAAKVYAYTDTTDVDEPDRGVLIDKMARSEMSSRSFAYVDSQGGKHLPIHDAAHVRNALARFNQTHFDSPEAKKRAMSKIRAAAKKFGVEVSGKSVKERIDDFVTWLKSDGVAASEDLDFSIGDTTGLLITKQSDGRLRWFARYSNSWEDRDKEIITEAAHKEYVEWVSETKTYPELWLWHTKGTRLGEADWIDFADGFAHASGLIDVGRENVVQALGEKELGVSHGFLSAQQGKYITKYRTFEISILPTERAAVWTTNFNVIGKETMMGFAPDKRKFLVDALGEKAVVELEAATEQTANSLKELGVEYKSADEKQEQETAQQTEGMKALAAQVAELTGVVQGLTGAVVTIKKEHDELKKTDDEKLEDAFLAKVAKAFGQNGSVVRPTASDDNIIEGSGSGAKESKSDDDFFSSMIMKQFTAAVQEAPNGGVGTPAVGTVTIEQPAG